MKIVRISTEPEAAAPAWTPGALGPGWNVASHGSSSENASLAGMAAHLLTGVDPTLHDAHPVGSWRRGELIVDHADGDLRLRRDGQRESPQLSASRVVDGVQVASPSHNPSWGAGLPREALLALFCPNAERGPGLEELLSPMVAAAMQQLCASERGAVPAGRFGRLDRRADESLLARRDTLAQQIETLLSQRRQEGERLRERLSEQDDLLQQIETHLAELRQRLHDVEAELYEEESRARYVELTQQSAEPVATEVQLGWSERIAELDAQIAKWRGTLEQLEARLTQLRGQLAQWRPDDASPELVLSDQRAGIGVAKRIAADLESEVARLAHTGETPEYHYRGAHSRLNPLVELLGEHLTRVSELIAQQDRALLGRALRHEERQVDRSHTEVCRQVESLLDLRETLLHASRAKSDPRSEASPVPPASTANRGALEKRRAEILSEIEALQDEADQVAAERSELFARRARLVHTPEMRAWQAELESVQAELAGRPEAPMVANQSGPMRASEVLARLSDGDLVGLRLVDGGRDCEVRRRGGELLHRSELTLEQQRLVAWSLRLALVEACAGSGVSLPIVLSEPFTGLDDRHAANLVSELDELRRHGRQLLLFTRRAAALDRLRSLGAPTHWLGRTEAPAPPSPAPPAPEGPRCLLSIDDPIEKFPVPIHGREQAFERARIHVVRDLFGADPSAVAEEMAVPGVCAELVSLWQTHLALVCFVPGMRFSDAKALGDASVLSVEDLAEADAEGLKLELAEIGVNVPAGVIEQWIELATDALEVWDENGLQDIWRRNLLERQQRIAENANRKAIAQASVV